MDTTVIPPRGGFDAAVRPCSMTSLGSVLGTFCPECDRDLAEPMTGDVVVLCEACAASDAE